MPPSQKSSGKGDFLKGLLLRLFDLPTSANLPIVDANVKATLRIGADPGFVHDGRAISPIIRQWNENANFAFQTFRITVFHFSDPSPHFAAHLKLAKLLNWAPQKILEKKQIMVESILKNCIDDFIAFSFYTFLQYISRSDRTTFLD